MKKYTNINGNNPHEKKYLLLIMIWDPKRYSVEFEMWGLREDQRWELINICWKWNLLDATKIKKKYREKWEYKVGEKKNSRWKLRELHVQADYSKIVEEIVENRITKNPTWKNLLWENFRESILKAASQICGKLKIGRKKKISRGRQMQSKNLFRTKRDI